MLDCMTDGRLAAGFPVGTSMDTNYCYGQIPALTREQYQEAHDLILRCWKEDEPPVSWEEILGVFKASVGNVTELLVNTIPRLRAGD